MTLKKYQQIKIVVTIILAVVFSQFFFTKNFVLPVAILIAGSLFLLFLRRRVKEVIADERDYAVAGKAASWAVQIYSWIAVISMLIFHSFKDLNPAYEPIALTLSFSTCLLMFIYSLIFNFHNKIKFTQNKSRFFILVIILSLFLGTFIIRLFSGEDDWKCKNGQWVKHGQPSFEAPKTICK